MRKRRKNLIKKAQKLSILYGVQVLCIVYSLDEPGVKVWPSDGPEAQQVLARYMTMPEIEQSKHMIVQERFIKKMIKKSRRQESQTRGALRRRVNELELAWLMDMGQNGKGFHGICTKHLLCPCY
ncbi:Agamous-like MADS-box protein AGL36 [Linum perenne]